MKQRLSEKQHAGAGQKHDPANDGTFSAAADAAENISFPAESPPERS